MAYVGNTPADKTLKLEKQQFTTSATTSYTLSHSVSDPQDIALFINNVRQNPNSSYTVSGTTLTLSAATASTDTMYCVFLGRAIGTVGIGAGSVTKDKVDFISDSSGSGVISKGDGSSIDGSIQLNCHVNSHGIKLKSPPHSAGQSYTLTFPSTAPVNGKVLQTDGSGNLSFGNAGALTLVHSSSSSSSASSFSIDNVFTTTYDNYLMMLELEASDTSGYYFRYLKSDGTERASNYYLADLRLILASGTVNGGDSSQNVSTFYLGRHSGSDITAPSRHLIHFYDPASTSKYSTIFSQCFSYHDTLNEYVARWQTGHQDNAEAHRGFKIVSNSGNIDEFDVKIWGYSNS